MNTAAKILMGILNERLSTWVNEMDIAVEFQAGFRKNYCTIDNAYNLASIAVWTGEEISEYFQTFSGVKQGCILSPLLFALYINDLHDYLVGGLDINGKNLRILLYADDIVIVADEIEVMQQMINNLYKYCKLWSMEINMNKSKVMVFRNGGRLSEREKWYLNGQQIETVAEYNYLGVIFTPKLSFKKHVQCRISQSKRAINMTWKNFLNKNYISLDTKWKLYLAICNSIKSYAAQLWGYEHFEEVDKLQRYFLKRILKVPENTPDYAIDLETNVDDGHLYTLKLHFKYISKTLYSYGMNRLPNFFTKILMEKELLWVKPINELLSHYGEQSIDTSTPKHTFCISVTNLMEKIQNSNKKSTIERAMPSNTRIYKHLDYTRGTSYMSHSYKQNEITWILKARSGMIYLNGSRYTTDGEYDNHCTLCNLREIENIHHFLGKCPILKIIRRRIFGKDSLQHHEILERKQLSNEPFDEFCSAVLHLRNQQRHPINEQDLVDIMKNNLKPSMMQLLFAVRPYGLDHFRAEARRAENMITHQRNSNTARYPPKNVHEFDIEPIEQQEILEIDAMKGRKLICWNCKVEGHTFIEYDVVTPTCPVCQGKKWSTNGTQSRAVVRSQKPAQHHQ
ncbi:uncharacterized protein LOC142224894 [Haematobia irritans]|uniref:uncharacterized protein LOC142224894 n=1 Tax=Haematobia irritans TaxID=7368 RepID=UPI003F4F4B68